MSEEKDTKEFDRKYGGWVKVGVALVLVVLLGTGFASNAEDFREEVVKICNSKNFFALVSDEHCGCVADDMSKKWKLAFIPVVGGMFSPSESEQAQHWEQSVSYCAKKSLLSQ